MEPELLDVAAAPAPEQPASRGRSRLASLGRWGIELVIVFIGVYAAFALSEYRQEQEAQAHREQIQQALLREIEAITAKTRRAAENMPRILAYYDSTMAAGAMPPLEPIIEPIRVRAHMWEATLQGGGLNLLEVDTMYRVSTFYNALNDGLEQLAQLRALSETVLIPNLGRGPEEFYDTTTKTLRPKYAWYLLGLRNAGTISVEITVLGDALIADLKKD